MKDVVALRELLGGLWHTTHPTRFQSILTAGAILPEPAIAEKDRWKTSQGRELYPYVRILGGVSLFDFEAFDPEAYAESHPRSDWREFVPYRKSWGCSVWIEIDREKIAANFLSADEVVARWNSDNAHRHTIMPRIEAAHIGKLPSRAFKRAFVARAESVNLQGLPLLPAV
jgi:hypothetical protein